MPSYGNVYVVDLPPFALDKGKGKLLVSFFLFSSANEFPNGVIKIRITLFEEHVVVVASPPPPILLSAIFGLILVRLFLGFLPHLCF